MTTTEAPARLPEPRRIRWPIAPATAILPELAGAPRPLRDAAARAREALGAYLEALDAFEAARADAEEAPARDRARDAAALAAGEELPERSEPAARQALAEANRRRLAAEANLREALAAQAQALRAHYGAALAAQRRRAERLRSRIAEQLEAIAQALPELERERALVRALEGFDGSPDTLDVRLPRPDRIERRRRAAEEAEARRRGGDPVPREPERLLAALARLLGEEQEAR